MSGEFMRVEARTLIAAQDMRTKQYRALRGSGDKLCEIASQSAGGPVEGIGVLQNKPNSGDHATVGYMGISKMVCGATVTRNRLITAQESGQATDATSGDFAFGMAMETGADGEVISVLLFQPAVQLTTQSFST